MKKINLEIKVIFALAMIFSLSLNSCKQNQKEDKIIMQTQKKNSITEQEVLDAQKAWGEGIIKIGKVYSKKGDYKVAATEHINQFYNYQNGSVLFKPTLAAEKQFRNDFKGALSYFIGGDKDYSEDYGFAIRPWSAVRWESNGIKINGNIAIAMGNYYFTPAKGGDEVKVEYSFAYTKDKDDKLKIILHGSHLPYNPKK